MSCDECKNAKNVSWAYVELLNDSHKATVKRLWILVLVLVVLIAGTNLVWLYEWSQYDYETTEYIQDGRGINIIGDDNDTRQYGTESENEAANP
jgi:hypothetical protein